MGNINRTTNTYALGYSYNSSGGLTVPASNGVLSSTYELKNGVSTPNYFTLRRRGALIPDTTYVHKKVVTTTQQGTRNQYAVDCYGGWFYRYQGKYSGNLSVWDCDPISAGVLAMPTAKLNEVHAKAINNLLLKVKDQKVNLVQALAERRQTAQLIGDTALKIGSMIRAVKKGDLRLAAEALNVLPPSKRAIQRHRQRVASARMSRDREALDKVMSKGILSVQYGWRPLLQDIYGSAELLAQKQMREIVDHAKSGSQVSHEVSSTSTVGYSKVQNTSNVTVQVQYKVTFASQSDTTHSLAQVGISNPALIAWELVPWSFVIDWFIPIGNYISSLDATLGLSFVTGSCSTKTVGKCQLSQTWDAWNYGAWQCYSTHFVGSATASCNWEYYTRTALSSFPSPQLPGLKNPASFEHALNAISLLSQLRKK